MSRRRRSALLERQIATLWWSTGLGAAAEAGPPVGAALVEMSDDRAVVSRYLNFEGPAPKEVSAEELRRHAEPLKKSA